MKYEIRYIFGSYESDGEEIKDFLVEDPEEALATIEKMKNNDDTLYIYNIDSGDQIEISFDKNCYFVKDLMRNGFYKKVCAFNELTYILRSFSDPDRDPTTYGMEIFE